jgi:hypothetical protein
MLYIEFGRNQLVGLAAIGKKHTGNGRRTDGRTDGRTHARTQTKIIVPRFRSGTKNSELVQSVDVKVKFVNVHKYECSQNMYDTNIDLVRERILGYVKDSLTVRYVHVAVHDALF